MYAVIFRARTQHLDDDYFSTAEQLRQLALKNYGCIRFDSLTQGDREIAISYWESLDAIKAWKEEATHREAQRHGAQAWYSSYEIEVVEVLRRYSSAGEQA